jgi:hypothetical protein
VLAGCARFHSHGFPHCASAVEHSLTGTANDDGSFTIHFGGDTGSINHLPIAEGWDYTVRFYQPRKEILDGTWKFPEVKPVALNNGSSGENDRIGK